jgi:hypothetical protein
MVDGLGAGNNARVVKDNLKNACNYRAKKGESAMSEHHDGFAPNTPKRKLENENFKSLALRRAARKVLALTGASIALFGTGVSSAVGGNDLTDEEKIEYINGKITHSLYDAVFNKDGSIQPSSDALDNDIPLYVDRPPYNTLPKKLFDDYSQLVVSKKETMIAHKDNLPFIFPNAGDVLDPFEWECATEQASTGTVKYRLLPNKRQVELRMSNISFTHTQQNKADFDGDKINESSFPVKCSDKTAYTLAVGGLRVDQTRRKRIGKMIRILDTRANSQANIKYKKMIIPFRPTGDKTRGRFVTVSMGTISKFHPPGYPYATQEFEWVFAQPAPKSRWKTVVLNKGSKQRSVLKTTMGYNRHAKWNKR